MAKLLGTPPLINITPLAQILEVPIHINNPIHPNSTNKHKRLGLKILNELSRIEMFVNRIETVGKQEEVVAELGRTVSHLEQTLYTFELENGKADRLENPTGRILLQRYMNRTGLAKMFPKASEHLGVDPVMTSGSFMEAHLRQMSSINQLVSIAIQLQNDLRLANHKFIAHQIALLYQCINQAGTKYTGFKSRVEEHFGTVKDLCNASDEPVLTPELQTWLNELTVDIVAEALFSGRPMAQQTPSAGPLSDYINRVSNNDGNEDQQQE
ncbi:hypothetical protein BGZ96_009998 [Linnemannia gamsii]|uniref:Uncharacterized protein n=1 Tax=Linnemannia gamsii TaxID=64522 RepID=A0ABQ7KF40_9FUNG|nr:hypothetical protein BGZ96_009998 [Linnemannia gamsii]